MSQHLPVSHLQYLIQLQELHMVKCVCILSGCITVDVPSSTVIQKTTGETRTYP